MSAALPAAIGFAAGLLGEEPVRVAVLAAGPGWVALDKPAGVAFEEHPWQNGAPTLLGQLRAQLEAGKPEMVRLGLAEPAAIFGPEPEAAGVALPPTVQAMARASKCPARAPARPGPLYQP